jgi:hypothetical protein
LKLSNVLYEPWATAVVNFDGTAAKARGCSIAKDEDHVYTVTLDRALDETDCDVHITIRGADGLGAKTCMVNHVSDTSKQVRFFFGSAGAAQATDFHISFFRTANGNQ